MRKSTLAWIVGLALALVLPSSVVAQGTGDVLNEAPLMPIPQDMTYEEYQDMNRRISTGLMRSVIPVPGMMHFYAGEPTTGKWLLATGLAGVASIIAGAALWDEGEFADADFEGLSNQRWGPRQRKTLRENSRFFRRRDAQVPPARAPARWRGWVDHWLRWE